MTATRPFVAPTVSRSRPAPADGALHLIGDTHFESPPMTAIRRGIWADDLKGGGVLPHSLSHIVMGDLVDNGVPGNTQDAIAVAFMNSHFGTGNWYSAVGNHDMFGSRTPDAAAAAWGMPTSNYIVDFPAFRLIVISPDGLQANQTAMADFTSTRLNWLNSQLVGTSKPCLIVCHWTLYNTVGAKWPNGSLGPRSVDSSVYATIDTDLRAVLAANVNAKAWISGHTHSITGSIDLVTPVTVGSHTLAAINCSAVAYQGLPINNLTSPIQSLYATVTDGGIDVRFRDHSSGTWTVAGPELRRVWSVNW